MKYANSNRAFASRLHCGAESLNPSYRLIVGAILLLVLAVPAVAQKQEAITASGDSTGALNTWVKPSSPAFHPNALPALDTIDAQTDIKVFMQREVPDEIRLPALRRAWSVNPAIRDFKGLVELDWAFDAPNSISGFGELDPGFDVAQRLAQLFDGTAMGAQQSTTMLAFAQETNSLSTVGPGHEFETGAKWQHCREPANWWRTVAALFAGDLQTTAINEGRVKC